MDPHGEHREITGELPLSTNAAVVLKRRYLKKDDQGEVTEGAPDMFRRVAETIAEVERLYDEGADVVATRRTGRSATPTRTSSQRARTLVA